MRVMLDTNFLVDVTRFNIDLKEIDKLLLTPFEFSTLDSVVKELEKISKTRSQESGCAKIALELIKVKHMEIIAVKGNTDKAIMTLSNKDTIVATNDSELRRQLKIKGVRTIYLKSKKHLAIS